MPYAAASLAKWDTLARLTPERIRDVTMQMALCSLHGLLVSPLVLPNWDAASAPKSSIDLFEARIAHYEAISLVLDAKERELGRLGAKAMQTALPSRQDVFDIEPGCGFESWFTRVKLPELSKLVSCLDMMSAKRIALAAWVEIGTADCTKPEAESTHANWKGKESRDVERCAAEYKTRLAKTKKGIDKQELDDFKRGIKRGGDGDGANSKPPKTQKQL